MNKTIIKQIISTMLKNIEGLSSLEYQKRVWIEGKGPETDDYDEAFCFFFEDANPILENPKKYNLTEKQHKTLKKLSNKLLLFDDAPGTKSYSPEKFINTPEWNVVINAAKEVLTAFNYKENDKKKQTYFMNMK